METAADACLVGGHIPFGLTNAFYRLKLIGGSNLDIMIGI